MRKIISLFFAIFLTLSSVQAENVTKTINSLINKDAVSVSVKDISNGKEVYSLNKKAPMIPASTLKLVTSSAALNTLGSDYEFSTKLYKSTNNDLYLKLGADPFLTSSDLKQLMSDAKDKNILEPKNFFIDSSIFDNIEWGEGWQWDDEMNPLMPKFGAYNLDGNLIKIEITPSMQNMPPSIVVKPFYPLTFMNLITTDITLDKNNISIVKDSNFSQNVYDAKGEIAKLENIKMPVPNLQRYFKLRLDDAIRGQKIEYYKGYHRAILPSKNVYLVSSITHEISDAMNSILKTSNNLVAETVFKLAGAKWAEESGSSSNSLGMLKFYLGTMNLSTDDIKIVDGSGVSKNNIMTADFMTDFLVSISKKNNFEDFENYIPTPGEGTLRNRMLYFRDNLRAKTGTLSDTSAIAGYIKSRKGNIYAFDIMINDAKTSSSDKKNVEEHILRQIYANY